MPLYEPTRFQFYNDVVLLLSGTLNLLMKKLKNCKIQQIILWYVFLSIFHLENCPKVLLVMKIGLRILSGLHILIHSSLFDHRLVHVLPILIFLLILCEMKKLPSQKLMFQRIQYFFLYSKLKFLQYFCFTARSFKI